MGWWCDVLLFLFAYECTHYPPVFIRTSKNHNPHWRLSCCFNNHPQTLHNIGATTPCWMLGFLRDWIDFIAPFLALFDFDYWKPARPLWPFVNVLIWNCRLFTGNTNTANIGSSTTDHGHLQPPKFRFRPFCFCTGRWTENCNCIYLQCVGGP